MHIPDGNYFQRPLLLDILDSEVYLSVALHGVQALSFVYTVRPKAQRACHDFTSETFSPVPILIFSLLIRTEHWALYETRRFLYANILPEMGE